MSYGLRFTISYKRLSNAETNIEIWQNSWTGSTTELVPDKKPLIINFDGTESNIYKPTNGSGATIKVLVDPLSMLDIFTEDPQEFIVKIYDETTLKWQGYVANGIYDEDYSIGTGLLTPITIQCNDGMKLLDYIPYTETDGSEYTGLSTIAEIITAIAGKLENKYIELQLLSDYMLTVTGYTNLFLGLTVNNENYYDESGKQMSCRKVLNSIFQGLGLVMEFDVEKIMVYDPLLLKTPSLGKSYTLYSGYTFTETDSALGGFKTIGSDLPYFKTGPSLDINKSFNQIEAKYDPYTFIGTGYEFDDESNMTMNPIPWISGYTSGIDYTGVTFLYSNAVIMNGWDINNDSYFSALAQVNHFDSKPDEIGPPQYFFKSYQTYTGNSASNYIEYEFPNTVIKQDDDLYLDLTFDVYINTKNENNLFTPEETGEIISRGTVGSMLFSIGDSYWYQYSDEWRRNGYSWGFPVRQSDADWRTTKKFGSGTIYTWFTQGTFMTTNRPEYYVTEDDSRINDTWTTVKITMDISEAACTDIDLLNGPMKLRIYKEFWTAELFDGDSIEVDVDKLVNVGISNVAISVINRNKQQISNDGVLITASLPSAQTYVKSSDLSVKLTNGTGVYGTSKGAYSSDQMDPVGINILGLYRSGSTICNATQWYVCQQLLSQYQTPRKKLTADLDVSTDLLGIKYKLINDTYLPGINLYPISGKYNDKDESCKVKLLEIASEYDTLPVVTPTPTPTPPPTSTPDITTYYYYETDVHTCNGSRVETESCNGTDGSIWIYNPVALNDNEFYFNGTYDLVHEITSGGPYTYAEWVTAGSPTALETNYYSTNGKATCTCTYLPFI